MASPKQYGLLGDIGCLSGCIGGSPGGMRQIYGEKTKNSSDQHNKKSRDNVYIVPVSVNEKTSFTEGDAYDSGRFMCIFAAIIAVGFAGYWRLINGRWRK
jgi:hypothetical protein